MSGKRHRGRSLKHIRENEQSPQSSENWFPAHPYTVRPSHLGEAETLPKVKSGSRPGSRASSSLRWPQQCPPLPFLLNHLPPAVA